MTRPRSDCSCASSVTIWSAGGELEHAWDVKSSTTTGVGPRRGASGSAAWQAAALSSTTIDGRTRRMARVYDPRALHHRHATQNYEHCNNGHPGQPLAQDQPSED